jgi:hypothetical protein
MAARLQHFFSIPVPRRPRSRDEITTVVRLVKLAKPAVGGTPTDALTPVEIEAIIDATRTLGVEPPEAASSEAELDDATPDDLAIEIEADPSNTVPPDGSVGSLRRRRGGLTTEETTTIPLAPVEIDAILQGADQPPSRSDAGVSRTVESVRLALGSSAIPAAKPPMVYARGPRRPRETLRADAIQGTDRPPRKR